MALITFFFILMVILYVWLHPAMQEEKREEKVEVEVEEVIVPRVSVPEKKARFAEIIVSAVNTVYTDVLQQYFDVTELMQANPLDSQLSALKEEYRANDNRELLMVLKPHPRSIAIAQAAMESSWATSRFFKEANNVFGVWSFSANEPRIPAGEKRGDKTIWIKKYSSIEDSVRDYYRTLARGSAYKEFRELKMKTDDPYQLVKKLDHYSEKGAEYGRELAEIIHFNKFNRYDQPQTSPAGQKNDPH